MIEIGPAGGCQSWVYLRKSRHLGDPDDPNLLGTHEAILARLAAEDGVHVPPANVVREVVSGEFLQQRERFMALLQEWERLPAGAGGTLYVMAVDRLSRGSRSERARIYDALERARIKIRTPMGTTDLSDFDQALMTDLKGILSEREKNVFKWRVEQTRTKKQREGAVITGSVGYGYRWSKDREQPVPHHEEFPILVACCREVRSTSIARLAKRYDVPPSLLARALHSPITCGWSARHYTMAWSATGHRVSVPLPRGQWRWAEQPGGWEPACSRAEWEAIQEILMSRGSKKEWTDREDGWCRDVIRFEGAPAGAWVRMQTGGKAPVYGGVDPATRKPFAYIRRAEIHAHVKAALAPILSDPELLALAVATQQQRAQASLAEGRATAEPDVLRAELASLRVRLDRAVEAALSEEDEEIRAAHARAQRELSGLIRERQRALQAKESEQLPDEVAPLLEEMAACCDRFEVAWETAPGPLKRAVVKALIAAVPVRITQVPGKQPLREALPVVWHDWLPPLLASLKERS